MSSYLYLDSKHLHLEKDQQTAGVSLFPENKTLTELAFIRYLCRSSPLHLLRMMATFCHQNILFHLPVCHLKDTLDDLSDTLCPSIDIP